MGLVLGQQIFFLGRTVRRSLDRRVDFFVGMIVKLCTIFYHILSTVGVQASLFGFNSVRDFDEKTRQK